LGNARAEREAVLLADREAAEQLASARHEAESMAEEWELEGLAQVQLRLFTGPQPVASHQAPPVEEFDLVQARRRLQALQRELRSQGIVSDGILDQYREVDDRLGF